MVEIGSVQKLTERQKEILRLLLNGHDAKSTAREVGISVHTVNEHLREARRSLGVSSSREAARLLRDAEAGTPNDMRPTTFGVAAAGGRFRLGKATPEGRVVYAGVALMIILAAAAVTLWLGEEGTASGSLHAAPKVTQAAVASIPADQIALKWLQLWDRQEWAECWREAGAQVKSAISETGFVAAAHNARELVGPVSSRKLVTVTALDSAPGLAQGDYINVVFRTDFARKKGATETVTLAREGSDWKVIGHHIL
jgi:DNA-binding CsgD family transcriptional regulator